MIGVAEGVLMTSLGIFLYAYVGYPLALKVLTLRRQARTVPEPGVWPRISIVVPVHNEAAVIAETLERLLALDYPANLRQILVVSDASDDGTDEIVAGFASRGVELFRLPQRRGKTAAENASRSHLTGEIVINTDASVRIDLGAVKHLVAAFGDSSVGVASARDVSVANLDQQANPGEQAYVGYEMWVRDLETRLTGIVGASGCLYAIRSDLHARFLPDHLSRDFAAALVAREQGYRAVSVTPAICYVPRSTSLRREYHRKVRTMARGLRTLWYKRALLEPRRHGVFAWMLWSHKLGRWLVPWALVLAAAALATLIPGGTPVRLAVAGIPILLAAAGWLWPDASPLPRGIAFPAYAVSGTIAGLHAWIKALGKQGTALWEPTRRGITSRPAGPA